MARHPFWDAVGPNAHLDPRGPGAPDLTPQAEAQERRALDLELIDAYRLADVHAIRRAKARLTEWPTA